MELWQFLGNWHPKLVQFPLVLLLAGLLFDLAGLLFRSARAHWAALALTASGTLALLFAFICGIYAEIWAGRAGVPQHPIELHELMANIASWGFVLLFAWRILLAEPGAGGGGEKPKTENRIPKLKWLRVYTIAGLLWYSLLAITAYLGGQLVFAYGAGVTGASANTVLTLADLNTLASRQTDENLRYSEWMHHVFGLMTLGLSVSLLAQAIFPKSAARLKWIVPTFLLAGGIFLFFKADSDLYALTDPRQWRDREVQLHKSLAIIMSTIGIIGLRKLFARLRKPDANSAAALATPNPSLQNSEFRIQNSSNSKLVAVLALIGGALLFTHVHTVAPYANVAAGVYIAHVVLGVIALLIGATRLLQDHAPYKRQGLAVVFAVFMSIESILLITYNEGLPWYIGYGAYKRWGPSIDGQLIPGITVAPFGDFRAELMVDQSSGDMFVVFRERFNENPLTVALDAPPQLIITQRDSQIAIPLAKSKAGEAPGPPLAPDAGKVEGSNFSVHADFVRKAPYLSARLLLKMNGAEKVGFFDPWVTPAVVAVPPNELAKFQCPMHEGIRTTDAGPCPLCGMELIAILPPRPAGQLHDPGYILKASVGSPREAAPRAGRIVLSVADAAGKDVPLTITHEQIMHILIVSQDLSYFDHIHPEPPSVTAGVSRGDTFTVSYQFPRAGRYLLFADLTPRGDRAQAFRIPLTVTDDAVALAHDEELPSRALVTDVSPAKLLPSTPFPKTPQSPAPFDFAAPTAAPAFQATLLTQPRTLYAGIHAQLLFRLADTHGRPLTDISPYLAAAGHCVILSQDTNTFIHSHPEQFSLVEPADRFGPDISFHATFPTPGTYRIWAQFRRGDQLLIAPFTVTVETPPVPAGLLRFLLNE